MCDTEYRCYPAWFKVDPLRTIFKLLLAVKSPDVLTRNAYLPLGAEFSLFLTVLLARKSISNNLWRRLPI